MKMPLFVVVSAQNSARIWKSLYEFFETRYPPLPRSATTAPSSALQFASPIWFQFSRPLLPSISLVHPASLPGIIEQPATANTNANSAAAGKNRRLMAFPPLGSRRHGSGRGHSTRSNIDVNAACKATRTGMKADAAKSLKAQPFTETFREFMERLRAAGE